MVCLSFITTTLENIKANNRIDKMARNLVDYEVGKTILQTALGIIRKQDIKQTELF